MDGGHPTLNGAPGLKKCPTGIRGLDATTHGGLPRGRAALVCGGPGCGKTLLALEFLLHGAIDYGEPGLFVSFEETPDELVDNIASLGFDLGSMIAERKIAVDYVRVERSEIEETGEYDLEALFIRLNHAVQGIQARRVVLDTLEALFAGLSDEGTLRAEIRRLFRWLKDKGLTAIVTGELGQGTLTRYGLEEYVSDCVILLDHRVMDNVSTRRLRIVKYRGSAHGADEYPFLIDDRGIFIVPATTALLDSPAPNDFITSGVPALDEMLGGHGYYRGSIVLVSGSAGTGKTSLAANFVDAAGRRGETALYFAFEESPSQIVRNMRSIGIDLEEGLQSGRLQIVAARPSQAGLEMHLAQLMHRIESLAPSVVVVDPITNFEVVGSKMDVKSMLIRLVDFLKARQITAFFTGHSQRVDDLEENSEVGISSLIDTWLMVRNLESSGERNRGLYVLKARGMAHSNQIREFLLTSQGLRLVPVQRTTGGILVGSARVAQEALDGDRGGREA